MEKYDIITKEENGIMTATVVYKEKKIDKTA